MTKLQLGSRYWSTRFARWAPSLPEQQGYSILVPVPGDLPVFLHTALAVLRTQQAQHRVETIVLPDVMTPDVARIVQAARADWPGELRLVPLPSPERQVLPRLKNPSRNHGVQVITGIEQARGTHVVLHDADLFLLQDNVLEDHWAQVRDRNLYAAGVSPVWDGWFAEQGLSLAATWELVAQRNWLRSFPPWLHMGHTAELCGQEHVFDTTLHAQALSDPRRIEVLPATERFVHFNYVISTYRHFQKASPRPFLDDRFRLVLVRLFVDLFDPTGTADLPNFNALARGLNDRTAPVIFPAPEAKACTDWAAFRAKAERILQGEWADHNRQQVTDALRPFDQFYAGITGVGSQTS